MPIAKRTASSARSWPMMPGTSARSAVVAKAKEPGSHRRHRADGGRGRASLIGATPPGLFYGLTPGPVRLDLTPYLPDTTQSIRRLNVHLRKTLAAIALVAAATLALVPATPAVAQEVVQDEGAAYRAWHDASQAGDNAKAMAAAKTYLEQYPKGQYADFITKWYGTAQMTALDAAIKEKRTADMITVGREILAADPENLNVLYALAFNIRRNELLAAPPSSPTPRLRSSSARSRSPSSSPARR